MNFRHIARSIFTFTVLFQTVIILDVSAEETEVPPPQSIIEAITSGKAYISMRYRYEFVDQDPFSENAKASTLQTRLGFKTSSFRGFSGLIEFEDVHAIGNDRYNSTINDKLRYPVVADPENTELNQGFLLFEGIPDLEVKAGRHTLVLDNARFIGDVGWRQNNQTFDGGTVTFSPVEDLSLFYGYTLNVNRIFSDEHPMGDLNSDIHMFNAAFSGLNAGKVTLYNYSLDIDEITSFSSVTTGGRFNGSQPLADDFKLLYDFEYAYQEDYGNNPLSYAAHYYRADIGAGFLSFTARAAIETLGSDNSVTSFSTPLATLHAWNGWADQFLTTPAGGLVDRYALLSYTASNIHKAIDNTVLTLVYHDFSSDEGSIDYGDEWDVDITRKISDNFSLGARYARYSADEFAEDTEKLIFSLSGQFKQ